jgi:hypothetical protein
VSLVFSQLDSNSKDCFSSCHWVHLEGAGGSQLITLSGVVQVDLEARHGLLLKERAEWVLEDLELEIALPQELLPAGMALRVHRSAPLITLNGLGGVSTVGWSVHSFSGPGDSLVRDAIPLRAVIGVYSTGEVLHRIGYSVTISGRFEASH